MLSKHLGPLGGHSPESPCWGLQHGPPSAPLGCRTGAPTGSEVAALCVPPHPALGVGSVTVQVPIGFSPK